MGLLPIPSPGFTQGASRAGIRRREDDGGVGVWDPKFCVPQMARQDFPNGKFRCFPRWSLWSWGGAGSSYGCQPFECILVWFGLGSHCTDEGMWPIREGALDRCRGYRGEYDPRTKQNHCVWATDNLNNLGTHFDQNEGGPV